MPAFRLTLNLTKGSIISGIRRGGTAGGGQWKLLIAVPGESGSSQARLLEQLVPCQNSIACTQDWPGSPREHLDKLGSTQMMSNRKSGLLSWSEGCFVT